MCSKQECYCSFWFSALLGTLIGYLAALGLLAVVHVFVGGVL